MSSNSPKIGVRMNFERSENLGKLKFWKTSVFLGEPYLLTYLFLYWSMIYGKSTKEHKCKFEIDKLTYLRSQQRTVWSVHENPQILIVLKMFCLCHLVFDCVFFFHKMMIFCKEICFAWISRTSAEFFSHRFPSYGL